MSSLESVKAVRDGLDWVYGCKGGFVENVRFESVNTVSGVAQW